MLKIELIHLRVDNWKSKSSSAQDVWKVFKGLHFKPVFQHIYIIMGPVNYIAILSKGNHLYYTLTTVINFACSLLYNGYTQRERVLTFLISGFFNSIIVNFSI